MVSVNNSRCRGANPNFVSSGHACARLCNAAWESPPSRGGATDAREKESLLAILRPEGRGPASYLGLGPAKEEKWAEARQPKGGRDREESGYDEARAGGSCPLDAATTAEMDEGDSSERRQCFAVVDRDLTGA
ncbi:hypothetical protein CRG98_009540 [Punica granatum]|uniref:Uncharacterized protein n=1 Tax=Punica granatum TaxID=22663 RepID=A0A2I0KNK7_PUNGR|nr:hypothetical protein CRG98_009540 [Punica granatum]